MTNSTNSTNTCDLPLIFTQSFAKATFIDGAVSGRYYLTDNLPAKQISPALLGAFAGYAVRSVATECIPFVGGEAGKVLQFISAGALGGFVKTISVSLVYNGFMGDSFAMPSLVKIGANMLNSALYDFSNYLQIGGKSMDIYVAGAETLDQIIKNGITKKSIGDGVLDTAVILYVIENLLPNRETCKKIAEFSYEYGSSLVNSVASELISDDMYSIFNSTINSISELQSYLVGNNSTKVAESEL